MIEKLLPENTTLFKEQTTKSSRGIKANAETNYLAFIDPTALKVWQAPGDMATKIHNFDLRIRFYNKLCQSEVGTFSNRIDSRNASFNKVVLLIRQKNIFHGNFSITLNMN